MNLKELYQEQENKKRSVAVFVIATVFQFIVMIWTATHNVPLLMSGVDADFKFIGPLAAIAGELFAFCMFVLLFFLAGTQRWVALGAYGVMMAVLLINSVVRSAQLTNPDLVRNFYISLYATFGAPFLIFFVIIVALIVLVELDPLVEILNARRELQATAHSLKVVTIRGAKAMMIDNLDNPEHGETVQAGASAMVQGVVGQVAGLLTGWSAKRTKEKADDTETVKLPAKPSLPERIIAGLNGNGHGPIDPNP